MSKAHHMMPVTIFRMTASITEKKSTTTAPLLPMEPRIVPNTKQKTMIPKVFVPERYWTCNRYSLSNPLPSISPNSPFYHVVFITKMAIFFGTFIAFKTFFLFFLYLFVSVYLIKLNKKYILSSQILINIFIKTLNIK